MLLYFQTLSTLYLEANHKVQSSMFQVQSPYLCLNLISLSLWRPMKRLLST